MGSRHWRVDGNDAFEKRCNLAWARDQIELDAYVRSCEADLMKPGSIVAISAGPVRLARVLSIEGSRATLRTLDSGRTIVRPVGMLWTVIDPL